MNRYCKWCGSSPGIHTDEENTFCRECDGDLCDFVSRDRFGKRICGKAFDDGIMCTTCHLEPNHDGLCK